MKSRILVRTFVLILMVSALMVIGSCKRKIPLSDDKTVIKVEPTPKALTYKEADAQIAGLLKNAFSRCSNDQGRDLYFSLNNQYLVEIQGLNYRNIPITSLLGLSPTEQTKGITWESGLVIDAKVTSKYDILNRKWLDPDEGMSDENVSFSFKKEKDTWSCELCERYKAIKCEDVQKLLGETKRYKQ